MRVDELVAGDLLPGWYDEWVVAEREHFRQLRLHALEKLCEQLTDEGRFGEAVEAGLVAVSGEPLRESAHRVLIRAYLKEGNRGEAIRQYEACRQVLAAGAGHRPLAGHRGVAVVSRGPNTAGRDGPETRRWRGAGRLTVCTRTRSPRSG